MQMNGDARILLYDLEITPILGWVYDMFDANVLRVEKPKTIMSFAYKWLDEANINVVAQNDFPGYIPGESDDYFVVEALRELLDEADIVVAHNANRFDNKVAMTRILANGFMPPSPFQSVDTLVTARRVFKFGSNSLAYLCEYLDLGSKAEVKHSELWPECLRGNPSAWKLMKEYNIHDVVMLEKLYLTLRPYMTNHPLVGVHGCPRCGSKNVQQRGTQRSKVATYHRYHCQDCGAWSRARKMVPDDNKSELV